MLKELQDQAFMKMMSEIPDEILDMQLGPFIDACEDTNSEEAKWGAKKFELAQPEDQKNVMSAASDSSIYQDALDHEQKNEDQFSAEEQKDNGPEMVDFAMQAFDSKKKPVFVEQSTEMDPQEQ